MSGRAEVASSAPARRDLLAYLDRLGNSTGEVRRVEAYRSRGWPTRRIAAEAERVAGELAARGVGAGKRVAIWVHDGPLWQAAFFGVLRAGAVAVPLEASADPVEARDAAKALGIAAWCTDREAPRLGIDASAVGLDWRRSACPGDRRTDVFPAPAVPELPPDTPDRPAEIVLTSGTSMAARPVAVGHGNMRPVLDALEAGIDRYRRWLRVAPRLRIACALPLSHLYGQVLGVFVPSLLDADAILVAPMPAPDLARSLRRERAWVLATVPRTLALLAAWLRARGVERWGAEGFEKRLAKAAGRPWWSRALLFARLRLELGPRLVAVVSGGAALDPPTAELWRRLGYAVVQGYGLTETAPLVTLDHPFDSRPGSLGRPLPGVELAIAADREILVRGANVVGGAVDREGWLHTGDLGRLDAEGRLWFLGRKDERIVTPAGLNLETGEIAARIAARPGVVDALVLERPWGAPGVVCAVLAVRPGLDPAEAIGAANEGLPDAARVRAWRVWPEADFPRTRTGKPRVGVIREWLEEQASGGAAASVSGEMGALTRMVAEIAGAEPGALTADTRLGDALGSLDRVELATRLEMTYGMPLPPEAAAPERRLGELVAELSALAPVPGVPSSGRIQKTESTARVVPEASWRGRLPVRVFRFALAQGVLRPAWRSLVALDADGVGHVARLDRPFLVASNHLSILDPGAVLFALPPRLSSKVATTAMWEHFERSRAGRIQYGLAVAGLDLIPLLQTGDWRPTLRIAGAIADRGGCPLVFPEGERSTGGGMLPFSRGVAILARDLHLPVVPCALAGLLAVLPRGARWPRGVWGRRARVAVRFGDPLPAPRASDDPGAFVEEIRARIAALGEEARRAAGRF
ncbi:MAG TPA: AMP-binding protein [Gemmatimonadota bacterium]|nr:AMP-binding protein [Gemmatimonadota bacterium]